MMLTHQSSRRARLQILGLMAVCVMTLAACDGRDGAKNLACERLAHDGTLRWGYYPGYGCGPVPRAQTQFSEATKDRAHVVAMAASPKTDVTRRTGG